MPMVTNIEHHINGHQKTIKKPNLNMRFLLILVNHSISWLIIIGIFLFTIESKASGEWSVISSFDSHVETGILVEVACIADPVIVTLFQNSQEGSEGKKEVSRQRFPQERGTGGIFYVAPSGVESYSIKVRKKYRSGVEFEPCVKLKSIDHYRYGSDLGKIQHEISGWHSSARKRRLTTLAHLQSSLENLSSELDIVEPLSVTIFRMMLELEKYDEIEARYIEDYGRIESLSLTHRMEIDLVRLIALRESFDLTTAEAIARRMVTDLDEVVDLNFTEKLIRERIRGELATILMMGGSFMKIPEKRDEAKQVLEIGLSIARQLNDRRLEAAHLNSIGTFFSENDDYSEAERYIIDSIEIHEQAQSNRLLSDSLNNLAKLYQSIEEIDKAVSALSRALAIESEYSDDGQDIATLQLHLAKLYIDIGDHRSAELYSSSSLEIFSSAENRFYEANARKWLGLAQVELKKESEGLSNLYLASDYFQLNGHPQYAFLTSIDIARHHISNRNFIKSESKAELSRALKIIREFDSGTPKYEKERIEKWMLYAELEMQNQNGAVYEQYEGLMREFFSGKGARQWRNEKLRFIDLAMRYRLSRKRFDELESLANEGYQIAEKVSSSLSSSNLGAKWTNRISKIFDVHSQALLREWQSSGNEEIIHKVFELGERYQAAHYRSHKLLEEYSKLESRSKKKSLLSQKQNILSAVNATTSREKEWAVKGYLKQELNLEKSIPSVASMPGQTSISIRKIQEIMGEQDVVLRFIVRKYSSFMIIIHKEQITAQELPSKSTLSDSVLRALRAVSERDDEAAILIADLSDHLSISNEFLESKSKLIYLADGPLELFPLSLIETTAESGNQAAIIDRMEVVRVRSISEYFSEKAAAIDFNSTDQDIAIFADPLFRRERLTSKLLHGVSNDSMGLRSWTKKLSRLPGTAREAVAIQNIFLNRKVVTALGSRASNSTFLSKEFRNSKVLHIATHGYFNPTTPNILGLATSYDPESENDDGFLSMAEIEEHPFNSNLVVISGCETILGENIDGEGLMGLDRSLMLQGAGSVIATHWAIPDSSTSYFMKLFYQRLKNNNGNASAALSETKRVMKKSRRYSHPFHWSAFTLTSSNRSFDSNVFN